MDYGDDAAVVTSLVGLEPTFVCIPGQTNPLFPKMTHRVHKWKLYSPLDFSAHIDDHFEALLRLLEPRAQAIRAASELWTSGLNAAVDYQDWTHGIHFSADVLEMATRMNLPIDLDLYFWGSLTS